MQGCPLARQQVLLPARYQRVMAAAAAGNNPQASSCTPGAVVVGAGRGQEQRCGASSLPFPRAQAGEPQMQRLRQRRAQAAADSAVGCRHGKRCVAAPKRTQAGLARLPALPANRLACGAQHGRQLNVRWPNAEDAGSEPSRVRQLGCTACGHLHCCQVRPRAFNCHSLRRMSACAAADAPADAQVTATCRAAARTRMQRQQQAAAGAAARCRAVRRTHASTRSLEDAVAGAAATHTGELGFGPRLPPRPSAHIIDPLSSLRLPD